ncbi:MAG: sensor histidine kinase [Firmicutes bacterium]|nr:sensor histidine kinase [Bacillota bacterium]
MNTILKAIKNKFNTLTIKTVVFTLFSFSILITYGYLNFKYETGFVFTVSTAIMTMLFLYLVYIFVAKIYRPITKIKKAIKLFNKSETNFKFDIDLDEDIYSLSNNISNMLNKLKESMNREYTNVILKKQAEFTALQSQINPHFLYNTLESIRGEALLGGNNEIAEMTEALSTFFRYSISHKGDLVSIKEEINNVNNYMIIQQYRFSDKFRFNILYDDDSIFEYMLPKMTMQPIVENSIIHGLETKLGRGTITIRIILTKKRLIINIADDGIGMGTSLTDQLNKKLNDNIEDTIGNNEQKSTGIALVNVNQRIKFLFGERYGLSISSTEGVGTDVEVVLPLISGDDSKEITEVC